MKSSLLKSAPRSDQCANQIEAETIGVYFRRPIEPKFQNRRRDEL
jgi:hypothetical protein